MKISVVIPVYQVAPWIGGCLESVFAQFGLEFPDHVLECIVVDDCGTDDSIAVAESMTAAAEAAGVEFHIVSHIRNRGQATARNTGTAVATGDYIFYLDGDDRLERGAMAAMAMAAVCADYPDWVQGNFHRIDARGGFVEDTIYYNREEPFYGTHEAVVRGFGRLNFSNTTNKLIRLDFIRENVLEFRDGLTYEDMEWCMRAYGAVQTVATLPQLTYVHNMREGSIMRSRMTVDKLDSLLYIVRELCAMPGEDRNVEHMAASKAVYGMKNLYLEHFPKGYRGRWMGELWGTGVTDCAVERGALAPLSRLVSRALGLPCWWARVYLWMLVKAYGVFLRCRGRRG